MESLEKNKTWILMDKPHLQKLVGCKWIFERKDGIPGVESSRYKASLVTKGFTEKGVAYNEIYSPVIRHSSTRILLAMVVLFGMFLEQLDVKLLFYMEA